MFSIARPRQDRKRQLLTLDNQIDTTTGPSSARAVRQHHETLFPNQFVNARLLVNTLQGRDPGFSIGGPAEWSSLVRLCHPEQRAHLRSIKPDDRRRHDPGRRINPGDIVADSSFDKLQDNAAVVIAIKLSGEWRKQADESVPSFILRRWRRRC